MVKQVLCTYCFEQLNDPDEKALIANERWRDLLLKGQNVKCAACGDWRSILKIDRHE